MAVSIEEHEDPDMHHWLKINQMQMEKHPNRPAVAAG